MAYNQKYNTDNVFSRAVLVGMINLLNNKIQFSNVIDNDTQDVIEVPWFPNQAGDERFMQDFFLHWQDCQHPKLATGNYDIIPRGILTLSSESINDSALTHRFIRGKRVKEVNGQLQTFNAYLNSIPLTYNFDCEIKADTYLDAMKITQTIREIFYATQVFYTSFNGFKIPCQVGFPGDYSIEKTFDYSYGDDTDVTITFSLELETYQPVMDKTSEMHDANRMNAINPSYIPINLSDGNADPNDVILPNESRSIIITSPISGDSDYSESTMIIEWQSTGTILRNDIYYTLDSGTTWVTIQRNIINRGFYPWSIPSFNPKFPYFVLDQEPDIQGKFRAIVDGNGQITDIIIFEGGLGYTNTLKVEVEETNFVGTPAQVEAIVENGTIVNFVIHDGGSGYTPTLQQTIGIKVTDSNTDISDTVNDILIT